MKVLPINYSAPMPERIIDGTKTNTRRVVKVGKLEIVRTATEQEIEAYLGKEHSGLSGSANSVHAQCQAGKHFVVLTDGSIAQLNCPYGKPGDRHWVRETHYRYGRWEVVPNAKTRTGRPKWKFVAVSSEVIYSGPAECIGPSYRTEPERAGWRKRLARFMPKDASRIHLEVVSVELERLHSISPQDAVAEGLLRLPASGRYCLNQGDQYFGNASRNPIEVFSWLWDSIHGTGSWDVNPWVWVVRFRKVDDDRLARTPSENDSRAANSA